MQMLANLPRVRAHAANGPLNAVTEAMALEEKADAIIEGIRPGVLEWPGFGPDAQLARLPRLVHRRMTGSGQDGSLAARGTRCQLHCVDVRKSSQALRVRF
jgi:hypothetical protein